MQKLPDVSPADKVGSFSASVPKQIRRVSIEPQDGSFKKQLSPVKEPVVSGSAQRMEGPKDAKMESIGLPSGFRYYSFKVLYVRKLVVADLLKIYDARVRKNFRHFVEAISNTLHNVSAFDLTFEDFWYVLYWHRLNSYRKSPFVLEWQCTETKHLDAIIAGEKKPESVFQSEILNKSKLTVNDLKVDQVLPLEEEFFSEYGIRLTPIYMHSYIEAMEEDEKEEESVKADNPARDASISHLNRYASQISPIHGETIADRRRFLEDYPDPEVLQSMEQYIDALEYGVVETFKVKCKECGAEVEVANSIDALTFLPQLY
jgi:regulator of RNase E activity RraB